jgi:hypothetical protein
MFGLKQSGFCQTLEHVVQYEMANSLAARIQVDIQLQLYHAHVLWLTASQLWTIIICLYFSHIRSYSEYLEVVFPSVIAYLPNTNTLSAPYPAFKTLLHIAQSAKYSGTLKPWSRA